MPKSEEEEKISKKKFIIVNKNTDESKNIVNKGTGAGGAKTNANGLQYEELTDLSSEFDSEKTVKHKLFNEIFFKNIDKKYISTKQSNVFKYMNNKIDKSVNRGHGCKNPDECFIYEDTNTIFIIEKKFQQVGGSVCEKIQTAPFKIWAYKRTFPNYKIVYIYCLSDWFKINCKAELEYLKENNINVFWGSSSTYKQDIISFIVNYK